MSEEAVSSKPNLIFKIVPADFSEDYDDIFKIRDIVYIKGQNCPYDEEFDGFDKDAQHFLAYIGEEIVGYCRLRIIDGKAKLERFAVYPKYRGKGVGKELVNYLVGHCKKLGIEKQYLNAQVRVQKFYENLGFRSQGNRFMEAGIEHTTMEYIGELDHLKN